MAETTATPSMPAPTMGAALMRAIRSFSLLRESWVGMIGAGLVRPPGACFLQALEAFAETYHEHHRF